jgi:hypothetical protein
VLADHLAQGGLGDLVDGRGHVLDRDHPCRIHHPAYATAETSMLMLSRVMMPWDWIGMVTIRSDTRRSTSISGTINRRPGSRTPTTRRAKQHALLVLLDDPHRQRNPTSASTVTATRTVSQPYRSVPFHRYRMLPAPAPCGSSCPSRSGRRTG